MSECFIYDCWQRSILKCSVMAVPLNNKKSWIQLVQAPWCDTAGMLLILKDCSCFACVLYWRGSYLFKMLPYCTQWLLEKNGSNCSTCFSHGFVCFQHVILLHQRTTFHLVVYCSLFQRGFVKQISGTLSKTGLYQTVLLFQKPLRITGAEQNSGCCVKWSVHYRG